MIAKLLATLDTLAPQVSAAIAGIGVGAMVDPAAGVATFGALWFLSALVDTIKGDA